MKGLPYIIFLAQKLIIVSVKPAENLYIIDFMIFKNQ